MRQPSICSGFCEGHNASQWRIVVAANGADSAVVSGEYEKEFAQLSSRRVAALVLRYYMQKLYLGNK